MIPFLDQLLAIPVVMAVTNATTTTVIPPDTTINLPDSASGLYTSLAAIIGFIGIILSTPGIKTWINHAFGFRKDQIDAGATALGTIAAQMVKSKEQIAMMISVLYSITPPEKRNVLDQQIAPLISDLQASLAQINSVLDTIIPKAHPNLVRMVNRNMQSGLNSLSPYSFLNTAAGTAAGAGFDNSTTTMGKNNDVQSTKSS